MIRGIFLLLGVVLGLTLAVAFEARMSNLRSLAQMTNVTLPKWSNNIAEDSQFSQGALTDARLLLWPDTASDGGKTDVSWKFTRFSAFGLHYRITLRTGQDSQHSNLLIPYGNWKVSWQGWIRKNHP